MTAAVPEAVYQVRNRETGWQDCSKARYDVVGELISAGRPAKGYDAQWDRRVLYTAPTAQEAVAFCKDGVLFWHGDHARHRGENYDLYAAPVAAAPTAPLKVFSKGPWIFRETGQEFSGADLDEAAFAEYRQFRTSAAPGIDLAHALDIMWEWRTQIEGHVFDSRDVARTLTSPDLQAIGVDPMVCAGVLTIGEAVIAAKREITRALIDASPKGGSDAVAELAAAAEGVLWFDWSDNDSDAVASIERLRNSLNHMQATSAEVGA